MKLNASNRDSKLPEASRASLDPSILRSRIKAHFQACSWLLPSFFTKAWATGKRVAISTLAISWKCKATPLNYLLNGHQPYDFCFNGEWTEPNWWLNWDQSATSMFQAVHRDLTAALLVEGKRPGWILRCFFDMWRSVAWESRIITPYDGNSASMIWFARNAQLANLPMTWL